jgi:hypothetical protein
MCILVALAVPGGSPPASGALGIYCIVEKVVFEPDEKAPTRLQLWGAFAFVESSGGPGLIVSSAARGYLYFRLDGGAYPAREDVIRREWADLKAVAGTGQAVGFGSWGYIGAFSDLHPDADPAQPRRIYDASPGRPYTDLRVRRATEAPASPVLYHTEFGLVKLAATGSHAAVVSRLKEALRR